MAIVHSSHVHELSLVLSGQLVLDDGCTITAGGLVIQAAGETITSGGLAVLDGGVEVRTDLLTTPVIEVFANSLAYTGTLMNFVSGKRRAAVVIALACVCGPLLTPPTQGFACWLSG